MKLAFISINDHTPWGGSEIFWSQLAMYFLKEKVQVAISTKYWKQEIPSITQLLKAGAMDFRRAKHPSSKYIDFIANRSGKFHQHTDQYKILYKYRPNFVFLSLGDHNKGYNWMHQFRLLDIPYYLIVQLVHITAPKNTNFQYQQLFEGYKNAAKILCVSYDNARLIKKQFGYDFQNIEIIHNPIQRLDFIPYPKVDCYKIALVARLNYEHKGHDLLLEAIKSEKWQNRNIVFNLYGEGPHEESLKRLASMWKLKNIHFKGIQSLEQIWTENHALLMPSRVEGLSLAFLEAMACRRVPIVTNLGDTSRFVKDGINGFMIKAPTVNFVEKALECAWQRRMDWEKMGEQIHATLQEVISDDPVKVYAKRFFSQTGYR